MRQSPTDVDDQISRSREPQGRGSGIFHEGRIVAVVDRGSDHHSRTRHHFSSQVFRHYEIIIEFQVRAVFLGWGRQLFT